MRKKRLSNLLLIIQHPLMLALPFSLFIWYLFPQFHRSFVADPVKSLVVSNDNIKGHYDFDNDGHSEYFHTGYMEGRSFVTMYTHKFVVDQWNFNGIFTPYGKRWLIGDYNNDGIKELYMLTARNDSLFLTGLDHRTGNEMPGGSIYLSEIPRMNSQSWAIHKAFMADLNNDGFGEAVVLLTNGFVRKPRCVIACDIAHRVVWRSPDIGAYGSNIEIYYTNNKPTITLCNYAPCNYPESDTAGIMHDHSSYRIELDGNLQFKYKPVEYKGDYCQFNLRPLKTAANTQLLSILIGSTQNPDYSLTVSDPSGNKIAQKVYPLDSEKAMHFHLFTNSRGIDNIIAITEFQKVQILDSKLQVLASADIRTDRILGEAADLDNDQKPELLATSDKPGEFLILREDLSNPAKFQTNNKGVFKHLNVIYRGDQPTHFSIQIDNVIYVYRYYNATPWIKFPALAGIYLIFLGFIWLIRRIQRNQLQKKYLMKQKITELKLQSIRNQMDPHFTFNVLNAIGSYIMQNKNEESYAMLMKYSKLLRGTISSSDKLSRTLQQELDLVTNYLELQKLRYDGLLTYSIEVDKEVDQQSIIPNMTIQTYVENAIKHGILHKEGGGDVTVIVKNENQNLTLLIRDNGIGRAKAATLNTTSTGKGLSIIHEAYQLLHEIKQIEIKEEVTDLYTDEGEAAGTEFKIILAH